MIALVLLAVIGRYAVIAVPTNGSDAHAVLLDRWTGRTTPAATPVQAPAFTYCWPAMPLSPTDQLHLNTAAGLLRIGEPMDAWRELECIAPANLVRTETLTIDTPHH